MKRKVIICICIILALCLLIPIPMRMKDGGTVVYTAVLYQVEDVHRLTIDPTSKTSAYIDGTIVRILGMEVFNNVPKYQNRPGRFSTAGTILIHFTPWQRFLPSSVLLRRNAWPRSPQKWDNPFRQNHQPYRKSRE